MSAISAKRYEAVFLCTHARGPHHSYLAAAKVLKKSKHFVQMWVERYRDTKTVDDLPGKGETRVTSSKEDKMIVALFKRNRPTRQKPLLSEVHMEKRWTWATENVDRDWSNVLFSDEASFWAWVPIKRAWSAAGERFL